MTPSTAATSVAARVEIRRGGGGGDARRQASRPAVGCVAILALAVAAVASLAPSVLLSESAWAQTDESLGDFVENGTVVRPADNGSSTGNTYAFPRGLASDDSGRLIVADTGTPSPGFGQRVVVLDNYVYSNITLGQYANYTGADGKFRQPQGVDVNSTGHIFVADRNNNRIQIFSSDGEYVGMFNESSSGKPTAKFDVGDVTRNDQGVFTVLADVAISHDEKLIYVTSETDHAVYHFNASTYQYVDKTGSRRALSDGFNTVGTANNLVDIKGQFDQPRGIDAGPGGLIAVAEAGRYVVNVIDPANTTTRIVPEITGINGSATTNRQEYPNNTVFLIGNTPLPNGTGVAGAEEGQFGNTTVESSPRDVAFSKDGSLLAVADPGNSRFQVFQLDTASDGRATGLLHPDGKPAFVFSSADGTLAVAFDSDDRLVVTERSDPTSILTVYDVTLPAVKNVTATVSPSDPDGTKVLLPDRSIVVTVGFNTDLVRVDTTGGTPSLAIGPRHNATYVESVGDTTGNLTFTYRVQEGDEEDDFVYDPKTALSLNGATITAGMRNVTVLTGLPNPDNADNRSLTEDHGITVDAEGPELVSVYSPNASAAYRAGDRIEIVLNYSERAWIVGSDAPTLALNVDGADGADRLADYFDGNGTTKLEFNYTVQEGDNTASGGLRYTGTDALGPDGVSILDRYNNTAAAPLSAPEPLVDEMGAVVDVVVDAMPPSVQSVVAVSDNGTYRNGTSVDIAVGFSEPVNVTGTELPTLDLSTTPARNATYVQGTDGDANLTFRYAVQEDDLALEGLRYAGTDALRANGAMIVDAAGNMANLTLPVPSTQLAGIVVNGSVADMVDPIDRDTGGQNGTDTGGQNGTDTGGQNGTTTCSITLGRSISDMDVRPGERSSEASQTVMNSGTAPFMAVMLEAEPWYVDLPANTTLASVQGMDPKPGMLPASLTEVRLGNGTDAMYAALPENGTAAVVGALAPGMAYDLSFMLDLTGQASAPGSTLTQFIEYTAECSDSQ